MITIYWLCEIESRDRLAVGETAWMLSQLRQRGYPIDPGFVISGGTWREFMQNLDDSSSILADFPDSPLHLDVDNPRALQSVAQQSRQAIHQVSFPQEWISLLEELIQRFNTPFLMLRSSLASPITAQKSDSSLIFSQVCHNSGQGLELAIKNIWSQLLSAQSLFYCQRIGLALEQLNLGVLIQPLTNVIASGMGTVYPHSFEIQANWGLAQSWQQGEVSPDHFILDRKTGIIVSQELGNKHRGYRLKYSPDLENLAENCLQKYIFSLEEQEQYCLSELTLAELFNLFNNLTQDNFSWNSLEWVLRESKQSQFPPLAITNLTPSLDVCPIFSPSVLKTKTINHSSDQTPLKGIGAAPGRIHAFIEVIAEETFRDLSLGKNKVIVTADISPSQLSLLKNAAGVITEFGGMISHAAILARELGIPAVVGVQNATKLLKNGDKIVLDGEKGEIYQYSTKEEILNPNSSPNPPQRSSFFPYPIATKLMVNLSQSSSLIKVMDLPVDGIGLLRSELMLLDICNSDPLEKWLKTWEPSAIVRQLRDLIQEFVIRFAPRPVFYRSFDGQPCQVVKTTTSDDLRGTRGYTIDPTLFDWELQALREIQQQGYHNLRLILPFVRSVREFKFCRDQVEKAGLMKSESFQLWIMAEVPSIIFELDDYFKAGVQGIGIGTNDLIPFLLGIGRDNSLLNDNNKSCPIAVLNALKLLIERCQELGIPCCMCGQIAVQYPDLIDDLIRWGITAISVESEGVEQTYQAIARAEQRLLLELARRRN